jgi:hypothetical protein
MKSQFNRYRPPTTRNAVENRARAKGMLQQAQATSLTNLVDPFTALHQPSNKMKKNPAGRNKADRKLI